MFQDEFSGSQLLVFCPLGEMTPKLVSQLLQWRSRIASQSQQRQHDAGPTLLAIAVVI
jgi:hypothetical protein